MATRRPCHFMNTSTRADLVRFVALRTQRWGRVVPRRWIQTAPIIIGNFDNDGLWSAVWGQLIGDFRGTDLPAALVEDNRRFVRHSSLTRATYLTPNVVREYQLL